MDNVYNGLLGLGQSPYANQAHALEQLARQQGYQTYDRVGGYATAGECAKPLMKKEPEMNPVLLLL